MSRQYKFKVARVDGKTVIRESNIPKKYLLIAVHTTYWEIDIPWFTEHRTEDELGKCLHAGNNPLLGSEFCYGHLVVPTVLNFVVAFKGLMNTSRYESTFIIESDRGEVPVVVINAIDAMELIEDVEAV